MTGAKNCRTAWASAFDEHFGICPLEGDGCTEMLARGGRQYP